MFQYAAGFRLATARHTELKLDLALSTRGGGTRRRFELDCFRLCAKGATSEEVEALVAKPPRASWISDWLDRRAAACERHFHYDPAVARLPDDTYLEGHWQSERYFEDVAELVRQEFSFRSEPTGRNAELAREIAAVARR